LPLLLLTLSAEEGAGGPDLVPGQVQDEVGGVIRKWTIDNFFRGVSNIPGALGKVYLNQQFIFQEKLRITINVPLIPKVWKIFFSSRAKHIMGHLLEFIRIATFRTIRGQKGLCPLDKSQ
jgi:hypothetical protein